MADVAALPKRWANKIACEPMTGCWLWLGYLDAGGYGGTSVGYSTEKAHRAVYEFFNGKIASGLQTDHLCRNRSCVNPDHIEPVTAQVNTLRGDTLPAANVVKTHCPQGHAYTPHNTYLDRWNQRHCIRCLRARTKRYRHEARERVHP